MRAFQILLCPGYEVRSYMLRQTVVMCFHIIDLLLRLGGASTDDPNRLTHFCAVWSSTIATSSEQLLTIILPAREQRALCDVLRLAIENHLQHPVVATDETHKHGHRDTRRKRRRDRCRFSAIISQPAAPSFDMVFLFFLPRDDAHLCGCASAPLVHDIHMVAMVSLATCF